MAHGAFDPPFERTVHNSRLLSGVRVWDWVSNMSAATVRESQGAAALVVVWVDHFLSLCCTYKATYQIRCGVRPHAQ